MSPEPTNASPSTKDGVSRSDKMVAEVAKAQSESDDATTKKRKKVSGSEEVPLLPCVLALLSVLI